MSTSSTRKPRVILTGVLAAACLLSTAELALATTTTSTFSVSIQLVATCTINSAAALNFGSSVGILSANIDQTSLINITCTSGTPFNIGLDAGTATGATVTTRKMTNGSNTISYALYSDSGRTTNWGNTVGTDTVSVSSGASNGTATNYTVYGRVPAQTTPPAGTYTDTITVTVTY
jgi:spore coat protein U-like protein